MPVFTDLEDRIVNPPFDADDYRRRLPGSQAVADKVHLVHVTGRDSRFDSLIVDPPHEIPTSEDARFCTDDTRKAEDVLGMPRSVYLYAGRAHDAFGNIAFAFAADIENGRDGSATPFDTGGMVHEKRYIKIRLTPNDDQPQRVAYCNSSVMALKDWRRVFARVLAAYFDRDVDYWQGGPARCDPDGLYELKQDSWRAWAFEIRFSSGVSIFEREAWCADENVMHRLLQLQDAQEVTPPGDPPTALDRFFQGPPPLEARGTTDCCKRLEKWVQREVGL